MTKFVNKRRWSDINHHWGIFTYCPATNSNFKSLIVALRSAEGIPWRKDFSQQYDGCNLLLGCNGHTLIIELPEWIKPLERKVYPTWDAVTIERLGRNWYIDYVKKEYSLSISHNALHVRYGIQTDNSSTTKSDVFFFPWKETRFVHETYYAPDGTLFRDVRQQQAQTIVDHYAESNQAKIDVPKMKFIVRDSDRTLVEVETYITETEHAWGVGWCRWLSWFKKPQIERTLYLRFSTEVGSEKGSWKGGLMGGSISIAPGEHPQVALKRFIEKERNRLSGHRVNLTYIGLSKEVMRDTGPA